MHSIEISFPQRDLKIRSYCGHKGQSWGEAATGRSGLLAQTISGSPSGASANYAAADIIEGELL